MDAFTQILLSDLQYLLPMLFGLVLVAFLQRGYFMKYMKVRSSRGKLTLVKLIGPGLTKYKVGEIKGTNLTYGKEGNEKDPKTIITNIVNTYLYREMMVDCIDIDAEKLCILPHDLHMKNQDLINKIQNDKRISSIQAVEIYSGIVSGVEGFDDTTYDNLVMQAKTRPSTQTQMLKYILLGGIILLVAIGYIGFMTYNNGKAINGFYGDIQVTKTTVLALQAHAGSAVAIPTGAVH